MCTSTVCVCTVRVRVLYVNVDVAVRGKEGERQEFEFKSKRCLGERDVVGQVAARVDVDVEAVARVVRRARRVAHARDPDGALDQTRLVALGQLARRRRRRRVRAEMLRRRLVRENLQPDARLPEPRPHCARARTTRPLTRTRTRTHTHTRTAADSSTRNILTYILPDVQSTLLTTLQYSTVHCSMFTTLYCIYNVNSHITDYAGKKS